MLIHPESANLLVVDIQEKLAPMVYQAEELVSNVKWLLGVCQELKLPIAFSEQYPRGLGHTLEDILALAPKAHVFEKTHFSCVAEGNLPEHIVGSQQVIICGMEAHVCVLQTAISLKTMDKDVFVVADCIASRSLADKELAIQRLRDNDIEVVSKEMVLFELLKDAKHPIFKTISQNYLR